MNKENDPIKPRPRFALIGGTGPEKGGISPHSITCRRERRRDRFRVIDGGGAPGAFRGHEIADAFDRGQARIAGPFKARDEAPVVQRADAERRRRHAGFGKKSVNFGEKVLFDGHGGKDNGSYPAMSTGHIPGELTATPGHYPIMEMKDRAPRSERRKQLIELLVSRIDAYQAKDGKNDTALSRAVTGGRDFVRDMRRGAASGRNMPGGDHLFALGRAMGLIHGCDVIDQNVKMPWDAPDYQPDQPPVDTRRMATEGDLRAISVLAAAISVIYSNAAHPKPFTPPGVDLNEVAGAAMKYFHLVLNAGDNPVAQSGAISVIMELVTADLAGEQQADAETGADTPEAVAAAPNDR